MLSVVKFAEYASTTKQSVYLAIRNGRLEKTGAGNIDETSKAALQFIESVNERKSRQRDENGTPKAVVMKSGVINQAPGKKSSAPRAANIPEYASKTDLEIERLRQQIIHLELKNQEQTGAVIARDKIDRLIFQPINTCHLRLMTDGMKSIVATLYPLIQGGATEQEVCCCGDETDRLVSEGGETGDDKGDTR